MRQDPRMLKPYIRVGKPNMKGFNTSTVKVAGKVGASCLPASISKARVNKRRINKETMRRKLAEAQFVPNARLILPNGKRKVAKAA